VLRGEANFRDLELANSAWRDRFWWQVYETLTAVPTLRFCRRCRKPFLAQKKQIYCRPSHSISSAERNRAYWARNRGMINLRRVNAYDAKIKRTLGAKVAARVPRTLPRVFVTTAS